MAGKRKMSAENAKMIRALIDNGRTVGPQILADDYLSIAVGMIGFACTETMITLEEHAAYWTEISAIKDARAEARKALEKGHE